MKKIFLTLILIASSAQAVDSERLKSLFEAQPSCGSFVRQIEGYLFYGYARYKNGLEEPRLPIPAKVRVVSTTDERSFELQTDDGAVDMVTAGDSAYILTYSALEEWNLTTQTRVAKYDTYAFSGLMKYKQHAQALAKHNEMLVIAHGRLGVSFFNLKTKRLSNQMRLLNSQLPLESMATGISIQGDYAYISMDNFSMVTKGKPAFRGIIVMHVPSQTVVKELDGMDPGAVSVASDRQTLLVTFMGGLIWKYDLNTMNGMTLPEPVARIWKFPFENGYPVGSGFLDDNYYFSCVSMPPASGKGFYEKRPLTLSRSELK